jgi:asparagine synthase (glutamine-hydrolysing)
VEENPELTIRSVVNNPLLYQEGWGVDRLKHSLTYSGGYSRACVRTAAPLRQFGFLGFSPHTQPSVVATATAIPFDRLAQGSLERLYSLKGEILARGLRRVWQTELPVFTKRRFQHGAAPPEVFEQRLTIDADAYRQHFQKLHAGGA